MKLGKLFKAVVNVVTIPLAVTKDVFTLGGVATGKDQSYTKDKIEEIEDNLDEITE